MSAPAPAVSFIVPARNAAAVLAAALDSLLRQTWTVWEAIVVDDQSSDATGAVAESYRDRDPRFHAIEGPGRGVAAARNAGLKHASAPWLVFLDADDWLAPTFLKTMLQALEAAPGDEAAYCQYQHVTQDGDTLPIAWNPEVAQTPFAIFARHCAVAIHSVVVRRSVVVGLGGFDESLRTCEDWDLWQRIARTGTRFLPVPECLAFYRISSGSLSSNSAQLTQDARRVIACGMTSDSRVADPAPAYANGAACTAEEAGLWNTHVVLWCMARDAAAGTGRAGNSGEDLLASLPRIADLHADIWAAARSIVNGAMLGAGASPRRLPLVWPKIAPGLSAALEAIGRASPLPGLARRLEYAIAHLLVWGSDLSMPVEVGRVLGMRIDIRALRPISLPPDVDTLYLVLCDGQEVLAAFETPAIEGLSIGDLTALVVDQVGQRNYLRRGGLVRQPRFWSGVAWRSALAAARCAGVVLRQGPAGARPLRGIFRHVAFESAVDARRGRSRHKHGRLTQLAAAIHKDACARAGQVEVNGRTARPQRNAGLSAPVAARIAVRSAEGHGSETTDRIPILMYHAVAESGPQRLARYRVTPADFKAQMRWLRDRGYHALTSADLLSHFKSRRHFDGRPVMLTFDDGLRSYGEWAWPILSDCGFTAENFIVTDLVGATAEWDGDDGRRQALMDWPEIEQLSRSGARFGSHLATHRYADSLTSRELLEEAARSRGVLEGRLQSEIISLAAPFGCLDERLARTAHASGYKVCYSTRPGTARIGGSIMDLPRIEVRGDWDITRFAQALETAE